MSELEDNIKSAIPDARVSAKGFHLIRCPVCQSKAVKAGFKFEPDKIVYNCFRGSCNAKGEYVYGEPMYKWFRNLMDLLGVEIPIGLRVGKTKKKDVTELPAIYEKHYYKGLTIPDDFVDYDPEKHWWFKNMLDERHADFNRDLYVGTHDEWKHKLIIPCFHNGKIIGWQGINYYNGKTFYLTSGENTDVMFINNPEGRIVKNPVIVEGIMDAVVIPNAIAIFGNHISRRQAYILRDSNPILLPDRMGSDFLKSAKLYNWRMSVPEWKHKDANEATKTFGQFVVAKMIHDGIIKDMTKAEVAYNMWKKRK